jgi:carbamate kinase
LTEVDVEQADRYLVAREFPEGSMGPKVRAAIRFVRSGGRVAVITTARLALATLSGTDPGGGPLGTRIVPTPDGAGVARRRA